MSPFPFRDLARLAFPGRGGSGWFLMLEGRFDDGGTHDSSEVVVWGGVMGDTDWFASLEEPWKRLLDEPLPGKPPIKQFHHSHISNSWGEFSSYIPAERDMIIKVFRDEVISARLVPVSFSVVMADWEKLITGKYRQIWGTAEQFAFMSCVTAAFRMARAGGAPVAIEFDAERLQDSRDGIIAAVQGLYQDAVVNVGFSKCRDVYGLQAADLVAYETFLLSLKILREGTEDPRPHFRRLLEGAPAAHGFIFRKQEIEALLAVTDAALADEPLIRKGSPGFQNVFHAFFSLDDV